MLKKMSIFVVTVALGAANILAQEGQIRNLVNGQKYTIEGVIVDKESDTSFIVRDSVGVDTRVVIAPNASIKNNSPWGGDRYPSNSLVRGLNVKVEGRGDSTGSLATTKVRFDRSNLLTAQSIEARVAPAEERLTAAEENARRVSGQIDELMAISNAARGGAKAAQDTADAAVAGVNATNQRISALDDYVVQSTATVNFRVNSAVLSPEAKMSLDEVAATAASLRGYTIEVTGFASSEGNAQANKALSERRARAVIDYLVTTHNIPLRRIGTSYGYGVLNPVADNRTREGREANRRVEVKLLVSRGINQNVEVRQVEGDNDDTDER
ncbi:OmpA family protein [Leptolyngbya sp. 7M]|uniref:OmpA family protein n=1 Tax=Leptolyngbya sp. 7M TaxID=2812896 RepID=UPI001B8ACB89|nr:OmpA family protein [Leptolyngbya sp. 7M]QYO65571.1 OmpA family protein [Leptolyngbya sp. 7M]